MYYNMMYHTILSGSCQTCTAAPARRESAGKKAPGSRVPL